MPIYEYRAVGAGGCELCRRRFEVRQRMEEEPLRRCPRCGGAVERLPSRCFACASEPLSLEETFRTYTEEEADALGLEGGFAPDQIWE